MTPADLIWPYLLTGVSLGVYELLLIKRLGLLDLFLDNGPGNGPNQHRLAKATVALAVFALLWPFLLTKRP